MFLVLVAAIDESDTGDQVGPFTVSGYVAFSHRWIKFSDLWEDTVHSAPDIGYYKKHNLESPKWRAENNISLQQATTKTRILARLIEESELDFSVSMFLTQQEFFESIATTSLPKILRNPYQYCLNGIIRVALNRIHEDGICGDCIDFIIDENDKVTDAAVEIFEYARATAPSHLGKMMGAMVPGNDKIFAPLQAADMLAGRFKDHIKTPSDNQARKAFNQIARARPSTHQITKEGLESFLNDPDIGVR
jgi:hypothetical protein